MAFVMSADADTLLDTIADNLAKPQTAAQDGRSASQFGLQDQLAVQKVVASKSAAARGFGGVIRQQVRAADALGSNSDD